MHIKTQERAGTGLACAHFSPMATFHFNVKNDIDVEDEDGEELENLAAAHLKAIYYARDLASAAVRNGKLDLAHRIDVADCRGEVLLSVTFADAIEIRPQV